METISKSVTNEEFNKLMPLVQKFPVLHNKLKNDFLTLLNLTEQQQHDSDTFKTLTRVCLLTLFTVIEADLFYYNLFDKYEGYKDSHPFLRKFSNTFDKICLTWKREDLKKEYFENNLASLNTLRDLRNKLTHPKEVQHFIEPTQADYNDIKAVFTAYDTFFSAIMSNFFFETKIPFKQLFK
ncbi:MAG: hypothetical protein JWQ79_2542 [Mucilaginibacter sp.]|nr:hypothetical protein [Mucilaginibacter sp.]